MREDERLALRPRGAIEIPQTVERVIVARIDRLDATTHRVRHGGGGARAALRAGAARGRDLTEREVRDALHELQRLDLIRTERRWPQPEYRFKHALIQEAAYRMLVGETRTDLHRRAAEWLEGQHAGTTTRSSGCSPTTGWRPRTTTRRSRT